MFNLQIKLSSEDKDIDNRRVFDMLVFSEKALPFTKQKLMNIAPELCEGTIGGDSAAELVCKVVRVSVSIETSQEHGDRNRIKRYLPVSGADAFLG